MPTYQRPTPEALLARARSESPTSSRGRLKLFFGASAGVGKTFAMLQEARERKAAGVDVVAGYVETHKRPETLALLDGLEELPPQWVEYRGVRLREFDLDAALRRRPALILVDELAHTNAEGLRHAKRWQDVIELLDAGIDVYTTVNVQHVESLNDIVARISGIVVRETIPDAVIERADEIELIDLPPDDLLQRLKEGKVYLSEQADRAAKSFFRKEILVALRELALRATADRVNKQVQEERAGHAIARTWPTAERLLVCVGPSPLSAHVVRAARRMAAGLQCEWLAVSVESPSLTRRARDRVQHNMQLAERLGAEVVTLSAERIAEEIISYAGRRNVTKIIIGKPSLPRWREWLRGSIVDDLIRRSGDIDVYVVKGEVEQAPPSGAVTGRKGVDWRAYAAALAVVAACTLIAWPLKRVLTPVNLTMIYLAGVVFVATRYDALPSAAAALLAPLAFNFFFTEPYFSLAIRDWQYVVTFLALLATALVVSGLTQRVRRQSAAIRTRYYRTIALYFMSRQLAAAPSREALIKIAERHIADVFAAEVVILSADRERRLTLPATPPAWFDHNEQAAAHWVFDQEKWAGRGTETLPLRQAMYVPLLASGPALGVLGIRQKAPGALEPDQRHMLETFATQLAIALERAAFAEQAETARVTAESEQVRNALLSCVSHDLRTPLATIAGSASTLLDDQGRISDEQRRELLQSIYDEGGRLNQLVGKLLDMTRLESPGFQLARDWFPLEELLGAALTRLEPVLHAHRVETDLPRDLPLVYADGVLIEEVFANLLENAARYTPPGSTIRIAARAADDQMRIEVSDNGPGLRMEAPERIFEKFVRAQPSADRRGTGLGLAICRAIVRLHWAGGDAGPTASVGAMNRPEGGACFWFTLPLSVAAPPGDPRSDEALGDGFTPGPAGSSMTGVNA